LSRHYDVSPFKLQPLFRFSAYLYIFFILVTFVAVAFPTAFYRNDDEMSQSILFITICKPLSWAAFVSLE